MDTKSCCEPTLDSLFDTWQIFLSSLPPDELVRHTLEALARIMRASYACVMTLDADEQALVAQASVGSRSNASASARLKLGEGVAGWAAQNQRPVRWPEDTDVPDSVRESLGAEGTASVLCIPFSANSHLLGVLELIREGAVPPFTPQDLRFAVLLADRLGASLYSARLSTQMANREQFTTRILESVPSSLVVIDRNLRVVSVNRNFLEKARRDVSSTVGRKIETVLPHALLAYTRLVQKVRDIIRTGTPLEGGKVAYRAPGLPMRIYYYRLIPLKTGDTLENVMLLMDDVTERERLGEEVRRAERHLASVVECADDLVMSLDPQGHIVSWNPAAERSSGFQAAEVKGRSLLSLCAAEHRPLMDEMLRRLVRGERVRSAEVDLLTADGQRLPIAWNCSPMFDDTAREASIVAVGRDQTEHRRLRVQLVESAKMASLGVMAGGIAHELRNPLAIISASVQLLLESPDSPEFRNACGQRIHAATQRASLIIENLLKFARPRREHLSLVDLHAVLEETFNLLSHQLSLHKVILQKEFQADLPAVHANPALLEQVFTNLTLNACNAMLNGGTLTVKTYLSDPDEVAIRFSDTGRGIPAEHLSKIFDPFFTTMPVGKGVGLGLSISYSIIQQHHGTIEAANLEGQGAAFTIRLPITSDQCTPATSPANVTEHNSNVALTQG